jgi:ABC-type oligopeptide transport system substrate-binding subunit
VNLKVNEDGILEIALSREFPDFEKVLAMPIFYPVLNAADPLLGPFSGEFIVEKNAGDKITLVTRDMEKAAAEKKTEKIIFEYSLNKEKIIKGFQNKEYDIIFSDNLQGEIKGQNITAPGYNLLWLNSRSEELKNAEARKAIFQSIDKKAAPQLDIKSEYSFTNSKLRMLIPEKPEAEKTAGKIADQISKKTGLEIEIISKNTEDYFKDLRGGNFDLALEAWESDYHGRNSFFEVFKNPIIIL